jgi:LAGLIDADG endonuclease
MDSKEKLIWAAGFVDGEGCISINRQKMKRKSKSGFREHICYTLGLAVSQKVKEPLDILVELFGGHLFSYKTKGVLYWRWQHWGPGALNAISQLLPYLVVKRRMAELGIDFQTKLTGWNREYGRRGYPGWVNESREAFYQKAKVLNQRGKPVEGAAAYEGPKILKSQKEIASTAPA